MKRKIIAIQGVPGAFHQIAAYNYYGENIDIDPCISFEELAGKVALGKVDAAIMAVENSISGSILRNLELIRNYTLSVKGETYLRIEQHLGVCEGADIETLKEVHSHYMALNQCRDFFAPYSHIRLVESDDTALSLKEVAHRKDVSVGAIGSALAIRQYGLKVLASNIETDKQNYTRFLIVEKQSIPCFEEKKVSMCMVLPHEQGVLSKVLSLLYILGVNLTKIESMPILGKPWQYRFYIDFLRSNSVDFHVLEDGLKPLVEELQILGVYPPADF